MIGVAVFSIIAAGVASATLLSSKIAISNIYNNTAHAVAHGYAEQIKSLSQSRIRRALADPQNEVIPTMGLSMGSGSTLQEGSDPLIFGVRTQKDVVVDVEALPDGTQRERVMRMWFTPHGKDLLTEPQRLDAIEITLDFEWEVMGRSVQKLHRGTIKLIKTDVSEF